MKKHIFLLSFLFFIGCNDSESGETLPDPPGTITINMDGNWIQPISDYIAESFCWDTPNNIILWDSENNQITSLGKVGGLAAIKKYPHVEIGWSRNVACEVGHGYIMRFFRWQPNSIVYVRLYVVEKLVSTSGGIMGAKIKYQEFTPENNYAPSGFRSVWCRCRAS